ncbi:MAG: Phosphatase of the haloacid dehalogenase (HAD)-like hydrolase family [Acetothermia bacterium 64_32]|nr:MAG: Phosphatase of the haloacid dehalogenase (HAD)-like hydrolase family [Acetothermia bacterium 64_32]HAF70339.1 hypothetical protein [Candidatus Acetothermia bacterium]
MKLALLDMDGTILMGRSLRVLAHAFGLEGALMEIDREKQEKGLPEREVAERIAALFSGRSLAKLYRVFDAIPLTPGASLWIRKLREQGVKVAIVSDSWRPLVERLADRLRVDLVWANELELSGGRLTGRLIPPPRPQPVPTHCRQHAVCKLQALRALAQRFAVPREEILAVGDGPVDVCMLKEAGLGIALNPKEKEVAQAADVVVYGDFYDLDEVVEGRKGGTP